MNKTMKFCPIYIFVFDSEIHFNVFLCIIVFSNVILQLSFYIFNNSVTCFSFICIFLFNFIIVHFQF